MGVAEEGGGGNLSLGFGFGSQKGSSKTTGTQTLFDANTIKQLQALIGGEIMGLPGAREEYDKESAIGDTSQIIEGFARQLQERLIPQLGAEEMGAGAYDSTAKKQMGNDLISRVAEQAAGLQLQTVKDYANIQQMQFAPLLELFGLLKGGVQTLNQKTKTKSSSKSLTGSLGL